MDALQVSAMFAAYVYFLNCNGQTPRAEKEAARFARDNWRSFLPCAHKGLGRLLIRIADKRSRRKRCGKGEAIA